MKPDLQQLVAQRHHELCVRGLTAGLISVLQIQSGYELAAILGLSPALSNHDAVRSWVIQRMSEHSAEGADLSQLTCALRRQLQQSTIGV